MELESRVGSSLPLQELTTSEVFARERLQTSSLLLSETQRGPQAFLNGVVDGAVNRPVQAVQQLLGAEVKPLEAKVSADEHVGRIIGSIAPFVVTSIATKRVGNALLGETATPTLSRVMGEQATAGFLTGSLLTVSELKPGESLLGARLRDGSISAATFATMSGASTLLDRNLPGLGKGLAGELTRKLMVGGLSGAAGGLVDVELKTGFKAEREQLLTSTLGYAAFGAVFEGGGTLAKAMMKPTAKFSNAEVNLPRLLASDPQITVISSPGGWYDKLSAAIYKAPKDHTIVVTDPKWLQEGKNILISARRSDINLVFDAAGKAGENIKPAVDAGAKISAAGKGSEIKVDRNDVPATPTKSVYEIERELTAKIRSEVADHGQDPGTALANALKRDRLVMVGEYHVEDSSHRLMGARLLPKLKQDGLTHLAIEHTNNFKGRIFNPDGSVDRNSLPELLRHNEFVRMLEVAKKEGIEVVPIDSTKRDLLTRNQTMAKELQGLLKDPDNKVMFWVGNRHLHMQDVTSEGPQVAKILRDKGVPLTTFYGQHDNFFREEPMRGLFTPSVATAVPTDKAPTIANLNWVHRGEAGHGISRFNEMDFVIMQPYQRPSHWD